jgi:predicted TIM-barrel fold metal-dependent hydrolase
VPGPLDRAGFEELISESAWPAPKGTSAFDAPVGLAIRRWCAPVLDLEPFAPPEEYLARREALGADEVNRRFLRAAGVESFLIDTGYRSADITGLEALRQLASTNVHEIVRLEAVAEAVAREGVSAEDYPDAFERALEEACPNAVGLKTIVAYRHGFVFDPSPPGREEVVRAAGRWFRETGKGVPRLTQVDLLRFGLWTGVELARQRGFPIQVHCGYGDPDLTLHLANPSLLTDWLRQLLPLGVHVTLLHCYPYHREAGYLAEVFPHVSFDVGLALNYTGPGARQVLAEALELAPFTKQLYSSDGFGVAEFHYLGAVLFRRNLDAILAGWVQRDECNAAEAARIARLIGAENARRLYRLDERSRS